MQTGYNLPRLMAGVKEIIIIIKIITRNIGNVFISKKMEE